MLLIWRDSKTRLPSCGSISISASYHGLVQDKGGLDELVDISDVPLEPLHRQVVGQTENLKDANSIILGNFLVGFLLSLALCKRPLFENC